MNASRDQILIVFVKNAVAGRVKTRLARTLGDAAALKIYRKLLRHTHAVSAGGAGDREVAVFYSDRTEDDAWKTSGSIRMVQRGADLGARMRHAFEWAFGAGYGRAVIIGSDCAELTAEIIARAFRRLDDHDVVLGPATDGGYYLLGMKAMHIRLFENMPWSSSRLLEETLSYIRRRRLSCALLQELSDIDTEEDLAGRQPH